MSWRDRIDEATGAMRPHHWTDPPPPLRQHDFDPNTTPPHLHGLSMLVPDVENVVDVVHLHSENRCIVIYKNGTERSVSYQEIAGWRRQIPPMRVLTPNATPRQPVEAPPAPPPPLPLNYRRIRLERPDA